MKEIARLEIKDYNDRRTLCGLLADNGYPVKIVEILNPLPERSYHEVVIYDKHEA